ncbi:NTP transferase domain-containing protein [Desulfosarcina sp. OttesenSCG-928-A07]|nr:NTP transferase domain-containing protein [Desulfosarcina sp. OttesenSCG-928-G17]MDL2329668.1 NTP transferase domain-containing protein [Desulfosarcina sp. OttesenSCG-928-A07]
MTQTCFSPPVTSIIMAAGRGSRMKGYSGNKTLLPLVPGNTPFEGRQPILLNLLDFLPHGPKALIVNHCKADVIRTTAHTGVVCLEQPVLNGTGGAILAASAFLSQTPSDTVIITMGDVPFVRKATYKTLAAGLSSHELMILGFSPTDKKQYGVLEIKGQKVKKITEWKYWRDYPPHLQDSLTICNSGIYAARRQTLCRYLPILASRPQIIQKEINGRLTDIEEFFFTDLIEYMVRDGLAVGYHVTENEHETMGIDDLEALQKAQAFYAKKMA